MLARKLASVLTNRPQGQPVPFGAWMPDLPDFENPGLVIAKNVIPSAMSYEPMKSLTVQSGALDARCQGAFAADDTSNNAYFYAGDATKLYEIRSQAATDRSGATYTTTSTNKWNFVQFGTKVLATNYTDPIQTNTIGLAANFSNMITGTNVPKAKYIAVVRDFVMIGNTVDAVDGTKPGRVWWSAIADETDFDPSAATQCDFQDIPAGGSITGVVGSFEYALVFQQEQITRFAYIGSPLIFDRFPIDQKRGCPIPGSIVPFGRFVYFISEDGFFVTDGSQSYPIGANQVDNEFWNQFDPQNAHLVSAAVDPFNKLVIWAFPGSGSTTYANRLFMYSWEDKRWSQVDVDVELIAAAQTQAYTLEDLDALSGSDIDSMTISLDADAWKGGTFQLGAFDTAHKLAFFNGINMAATFQTGEVQLAQGRRTLVRKVRPLVDGSNVMIRGTVGARKKLTETETYTSSASEDAIGEMSFLSDGRYHRFQVTTDVGDTWEHAQGVAVTHTPRGHR